MARRDLWRKVDELERDIHELSSAVQSSMMALISKVSALDQEIVPGLMKSDLLRFEADLGRRFKRR